jgi:uncharacterized protein (TIGR03083 family)
VEPRDLLRVAGIEARGLIAAAETKWTETVPHCPEWDAAELVRHTGTIFGWMAAVVETGERVGFGTLGPAPENPEDLPPWYEANLRRALDVLGSADPASETWTFSSTGDRRARWWCRRLAVEVSIHRWDVDHAMAGIADPPPTALDGEVAQAGIEEYMIEFLPGLLAKARPDGQDGAGGRAGRGARRDQENWSGIAGISGTFHLHATDGTAEWWIDLDAGGPAVQQHAKADMAVRGTRSDLLLWLTNRGPLESLELFGDEAIVECWKQFQR